MRSAELVYKPWNPPQEVESDLLWASIYVGSVFGKTVEVWVKGRQIIFDPEEPVPGGELVGVYNAMKQTFDDTAFMQDICVAMKVPI